ncbi:acyltransferase [Ectobacillus funiculus]|uniref:acyltransferase n=1 Tax=Ectobacillus funiculus TaxID=137993 RepID=UPI00101D0638|nr:acyltransferase [Ectobacillus funiculus]
MIKITNKIISKMKNEKYVLDENITFFDLCSIVLTRILMLTRGFLKRVLFKSCGKNLFIGKKTTIRHKSHIKLGKSVTINDYVEMIALSQNGITIGDNASIGKYSIIRCTGSLKNLGKGIRIGDNFGCGDWCFFGCSGGIEIGNNVIMGQNIRFHAQNHNFDRIDIPIKNQGTTSKGIVVEDDCWIGAGVVILDGVTIGKGSVIGSNTLVNKDIEPYSVAVGNPVKIVKKRAGHQVI